MPRQKVVPKKKKKVFKPLPAVIVDRTLEAQFGSVKKYEVCKLLGQGGFARVYAVRSLTSGYTYAIKIVQKSSLVKEAQKNKIRYEIRIHRVLSHKFVVKFERNFEDRDNVYMLMEYCNHQTLMELKKRRKRVTEPEVQYYIRQILQAVGYIHNMKVIHRDLKLGNVLIDNKMNVKLADFGLATQLVTTTDRKTTICGTPNYIAPEVLQGNRKGGHSFGVDVWSTGVIMYTLLVGKPPFQTGTVNKTYQRIKGAKYTFPLDVDLSGVAKNCIEKMLVKNAAVRSTVKQVLEDLFFTIKEPPSSLPVSALTTPPAGFPQMLTELPWYKEKPPKRRRDKSLSAGRPPTKKPRTTGLPTYFAAQAAAKEKGGAGRRKENNGAGNGKREFLRTATLKSEVMELLRGNTEKQKQAQTNQLQFKVGRRPSKGTPKEPQGDGIESIPDGHPTIFVCQWLDYTRKYGIGYLLSNNQVGVYFNDFTKILLDVETHEIAYVGNRLATNTKKTKAPPVEECQVNEYPEHLRKKVTLSMHFANHFKMKILEKPKTRRKKKKEERVFVEQCLRTSSAMVFRMTNNSVQVNFKDNSELILQEFRKSTSKNSKSSLVTFTDCKEKRATYQLSDLLKGDSSSQSKWMASLMKRLKYTRELLTRAMPGDP